MWWIPPKRYEALRSEVADLKKTVPNEVWQSVVLKSRHNRISIYLALRKKDTLRRSEKYFGILQDLRSLLSSYGY